MNISIEQKLEGMGNPKVCDPNTLRDFAKMFLAHKERGKDFIETAIHCLEYASRLNPNNEDIFIDLANAYIENNQFDRASDIAKLLLSMNKAADKAHALLGSLYLSQGEKTKAKRHLEEALILTEYTNLNYLRNYFFTEELNETEREYLLDHLLNLVQTNHYEESKKGELYYLIAEIYNKKSDYAQAVYYWEEGAELIRNSIKEENINLIFEYLKACIKSLSEENFQFLDQYRETKFFNLQDSEPKLIIIVGLPRTGSTLIQQLLLTHNDVSSVGESNYFAQALVNELKQDLREIFSNIKKISNENLINIKNTYLNLVNSSSKVIIDKTLSNFLYVPIIQTCFPEAKIIFTDRDWEETRFSCFTQYFTDNQVIFSYSFTELNKYQDLYQKILSKLKNSKVFFIEEYKYEDLVNNPELLSQKIFSLADLKWTTQALEFHKNKKTVLTASLTQVRKPIYKSSLKKWDRYKSFFKKEEEHDIK